MIRVMNKSTGVAGVAFKTRDIQELSDLENYLGGLYVELEQGKETNVIAFETCYGSGRYRFIKGLVVIFNERACSPRKMVSIMTEGSFEEHFEIIYSVQNFFIDRRKSGISEKQQLENADRQAGFRNEKPVNTKEPNVDHPAHYNAGKIEVIDAIEEWGLGFNLGNVVKYVARAGKKTEDPVEDLKKALWYLEREIKRTSGK